MVTAEQAQLAVSIASVVFSGALTLVTYFYYIETRDQTEELEKTRKAEFRPILKPTIDGKHGHLIKFSFENTGNGAAHNVDAEWSFSDHEYTEQWELPLISSGERYTFFLPFDTTNPIVNPEEIIERLDEDEKLVFNATYEDAIGNPYSTDDEEVNIISIIKAHQESKEAWEKDGTEQIAQEFSKLNRNLSKMHDPFMMTEIKELLTSHKSERILEMLEDRESVTIGELEKISGLSNSVNHVVQQFAEAGLVELENEAEEEPSAYSSDTVVSLAGGKISS